MNQGLLSSRLLIIAGTMTALLGSCIDFTLIQKIKQRQALVMHDT